jgi:membrane protein implicated in regulation of membrane protease activity
MNWETFYLIAFLVGFLLSVASFLTGALHGAHIHVGHFHLHGWHAGKVKVSGRTGVSPFNVGTAAAFLAWFGGTGYLLERYSSIWAYLGLLVSIVSGTAAAALVFWFLSKLVRHDEAMDPLDYDMTGVLGRVTSPIRPDGTGEILFLRDGARKAAPARSEDARPIPRDTEVIVTRYERGVAYVRKWEEFT